MADPNSSLAWAVTFEAGLTVLLVLCIILVARHKKYWPLAHKIPLNAGFSTSRF
jgi:hypothetical protein